VSNEQSALWAEQAGADGLILTGSTFDDSLRRVAAARAAGVGAPILVGGSVTAENVGRSLAAADGVIVSRALMKKDQTSGGLERWDRDLTRAFMDAAGVAAARRPMETSPS
jgi:predicted TIM-barrel enzyme